jgi:hypothetical protein
MALPTFAHSKLLGGDIQKEMNKSLAPTPDPSVPLPILYSYFKPK